jgi:hypothetical protein
MKGRPPQLHYRPPYSPDLNPIENAFAKLKEHVRNSAARTLDALDRAAANALHQFKPDECASFFAHAGSSLGSRDQHCVASQATYSQPSPNSKRSGYVILQRVHSLSPPSG